jgi:hypothetical protein
LAGLDEEEPGYAAAKKAVSMSPEAEIVSSDDKTGTIVVRDQKKPARPLP